MGTIPRAAADWPARFSRSTRQSAPLHPDTVKKSDCCNFSEGFSEKNFSRYMKEIGITKVKGHLQTVARWFAERDLRNGVAFAVISWCLLHPYPDNISWTVRMIGSLDAVSIFIKVILLSPFILSLYSSICTLGEGPFRSQNLKVCEEACWVSSSTAECEHSRIPQPAGVGGAPSPAFCRWDCGLEPIVLVRTQR